MLVVSGRFPAMPIGPVCANRAVIGTSGTKANFSGSVFANSTSLERSAGAFLMSAGEMEIEVGR